MPDSTHKPATSRVGVALAIGGDAGSAVHIRTDPAGVTAVTGLLADLSGPDGVTVDVVAVVGRTGGPRATVRRYTVPAAAVGELVERTLELDR